MVTPQVRRILIYWFLSIAMVGGCVFEPPEGETFVIDLSKEVPVQVGPVNPFEGLYESMLYTTVRIKAGFSCGSGVIINGYIITAAHVVDNESIVTVELFYPEYIEIDATVLVTDTAKDLALIKICNLKSGICNYSATLAPRNYTPYIFTPVYAVGCSLGLKVRPSYGIISIIEPGYCEISAPILPGNSGGPVFALVPSNDGNASTYEVIGISVWVRVYKDQLITTMGGIVPIQEIYDFLEENNICFK
ncbi:MAG: serine protease [Candidatus Brocadiia bacterium]